MKRNKLVSGPSGDATCLTYRKLCCWEYDKSVKRAIRVVTYHIPGRKVMDSHPWPSVLDTALAMNLAVALMHKESGGSWSSFPPTLTLRLCPAVPCFWRCWPKQSKEAWQAAQKKCGSLGTLPQGQPCALTACCYSSSFSTMLGKLRSCSCPGQTQTSLVR